SPRLDGADRDVDRGRHGEAHRRLHRADPRAREPGDAPEDRADERRQLLPREYAAGARRRLQEARDTPRPHEGGPADNRPLRRRRRRAPGRGCRPLVPLVPEGPPVRRLLVLCAVAAVASLVAAGTAGATRECNGFQVCVPVAGPWVLTPGRAETHWQLSCPKNFIVG